MNDDVIVWETLEYTHHEKNADWFWILGIVVVVGVLISIVIGNTLFAIFIALGGFVVSIYATKHPDVLRCVIDRRGVHVNEFSYLHKDMDTFWIDETHEDTPKLLMTPKNKLSLQIGIPLGDVDLDEAHEYLSAYIHEEEQNETFTEQIMEWLKI